MKPPKSSKKPRRPRLWIVVEETEFAIDRDKIAICLPHPSDTITGKQAMKLAAWLTRAAAYLKDQKRKEK